MLFDHTANYIKHTGSGGQVTSEDGYDILFTDADGLIQLDHEIESYTPSTGHLVAWVRIPTLEYDSDTTIKLTWGDGSIETSQENAAGVWQDDFEAVWHFDETSGNHIDSTGHGNTGAPSVTTQGSATGKIDGCDAFDGVDDGIIVASTSRLDALTAVSIEVWALTTDNSQDDQTVINLRKDAIDRAYLVYDKTANIGFILYDDIDDVSQWRCRSDLIPTNDQWYYLVWTMDGTNWRLRIKSGASTWNESEVAGNTLEYLDDGYNVYIGRRTGEGDRPWKGRIDEVCISSTPRSNDWIDTRFNSMNSPSTFYSLESGTTTTTTTTTCTTTSTPPP
jgi:hypothetical protein